MSSSPILKCSICPSSPTFSDISHLLTHVSSKGHLACYFKHQVQSHQEPEAKKLLTEYDAWYKEHDLARLLSDRMRTQQKSKRKGQQSQSGKRGAFTGGASKLCVKHAPPEIYEPDVPSTKDFLPVKLEFLSFMDPQLTNEDSPLSAPDCLPTETRVPFGDFNSHLDQKHCIFQHQTQQTEPQETPLNSPFPVCPFDVSNGDGQFSLPTTTTKQEESSVHVPAKHHRISQVQNGTDQQSQFSVFDDPDYIDEEEEIRQAKLKGTLWPGMDIFDSATVQMRKKRNQKKDDTALTHMRRTSKGVEPTEQIFSPGGTLQTERVISGNVDDWTPIKGESPPVRRRGPRLERNALAPAEPNISHASKSKRGPRGKGKGKDGPKLPRKTLKCERDNNGGASTEAPMSMMPFSTTNQPPIVDDDTFMTMGEGMTRKHCKGNRGGAFKIFNDKTEAPRRSEKEGGRRAKPATTHPPPSFYGVDYEHHNPGSAMDNNGLPSYYQKPCGNNRANTLPGYSMGKENIYPGLTGGGAFTNCPQFYYPESPRSIPRPPFQQYEDPNPFGHGCNPLAFTLTHLPEEKIQDISMSIDSKNQQQREASPDGTISDLDRDDFSYVLKDL